MKVLAFAATNSRESINKQLVGYAANQLVEKLNQAVELNTIDLNDFEMPIYSIDREKESGIPAQAQEFLDHISAADAVLISFAEHNGTFTAAYKNIFGWASRINMKVYENKPVVLLATSPGGRGGMGVISSANQFMPHFGADIQGSFTLPSFYDNFDMNSGRITDEDKVAELDQILSAFAAKVA